LSRTNSTYQASLQNFFPFSYGETIGESAPDDFLYVKENHLGNVLTVVSDRKLGVDNVNNTTGVAPPDGLVDYYLADVVSATDYYAFGSPMPGRQFNSTSYRYGFNGHEKDDEIKGTGNSYDYGARIYDPRIGRFLTIDPAYKKFPWLTPFQFASNRPIDGIDLDGLEYLDSKAKVMIINNVIAYKADNLSNPFQNWLRTKDATTIIADVTYNIGGSNAALTMRNEKPAPTIQQPSDDPDLATASEGSNTLGGQSNEINIVTSNKSIEGNVASVRNFNLVNGKGVDKVSKGLAVVEALTYLSGKIQETMINADISSGKSQMTAVANALADVSTAIAKGGYIENKYLSSSTALSNIANVVLTGQLSNTQSSCSTCQQENENLIAIGMKIYNEISKPKTEAGQSLPAVGTYNATPTSSGGEK